MQAGSDDSDAEEMKRLMGDGDNDSAEDSDEDMEGSEEGEQSMSEGESDPDEAVSSGSEDSNKMVGKKRSLKDRLKEEQNIRSQEKKMRSG